MMKPVVYSWQSRRTRWALHETTSSAPWSFQLHRHEGFCDLTLVCTGQVINVVNGRETPLAAGTLAWTREQDLHRLEGTEFRYLNLNLAETKLELLAAAVGREREFKALRAQPATPWAHLGPRASRVEAEWFRLFQMQRNPEAELLVHQLALGVLAELIAAQVDPAATRADLPAWLTEGMAYAQGAIETGVTVRDLVRVCARSPEHVSRSFSRHLGLSPSAWLNQQRLARAALLLTCTNREILDICFRVGFQSASYFYRRFRSAYAMTPRQYRARYGQPH